MAKNVVELIKKLKLTMDMWIILKDEKEKMEKQLESKWNELNDYVKDEEIKMLNSLQEDGVNCEITTKEHGNNKQDIYTFTIHGLEIAKYESVYYKQKNTDVNPAIEYGNYSLITEGKIDRTFNEIDEEKAKNLILTKKQQIIEKEIDKLIKQKKEKEAAIGAEAGDVQEDAELKSQLNDINEKLDAYQSYVIRTDDEEIKRYIEQYNKEKAEKIAKIKNVIDKINEKFNKQTQLKIDEETDFIKQKEDFNDYCEKNRIKSKELIEDRNKILDELYKKENLKELEAFADNKNNDEELRELAYEVLKPYGKGKVKINIKI